MGDLRFDNHVAIVTGAGRGIGRSHARTLASRNVRVVVNDLDLEAANVVVEEIVSEGGVAIAAVADLTTAEGIASTIDAALGDLGGLDIIVGNAGRFSQHQVLELELENLRGHLELDVVASFRMIRAGWKHFTNQQYGRIVLTSSSAAFGSSTEIAYGVGKSAVIGLTRALAVAGGNDGIKVNAIVPFGFSRMTEANGNLTPGELSARATLIPPRLVSAGVTALVHESCPTTGQLFLCGGGRMAKIELVQAEGYMNPELTPEDVVSHWDQVLSDRRQEDVGFMYDHLKRFVSDLPGWVEAMATAANSNPG